MEPDNARDWSRLALGIVTALMMLFAGRMWGESVMSNTVERATRNETSLSALTTRFEDHTNVQSEQNRQVLTQLAEIRRLVQEQQ